MKIMQEGLTFDDVLLIPAHSTLLPHEACTSTKLTQSISLSIPLISAAMDTVTESQFAIALAQEGGIGIIHRHMSIIEQVQQVINVKNIAPISAFSTVDEAGRLRVGAAVGVDQHSKDRVKQLHQANVDIIVIDTAHGHSQKVLDMVSWIKNYNEKIQVIAGNIVTAQAAIDLVRAGADTVKVGIGPGAACTTRLIAGVGFPQLTAIMHVAQALKGMEVPIIADGGVRYSGDIGKAIAAGASTVMLGNLFAGTDESPGNIIFKDEIPYKTYRGMHSLGALSDKHSREDNHFAQRVEKLVAEGAEGAVPYKGSLKDVVCQLIGGLRACMGYTGCATIADLHQKAEFVRITASGARESQPHGINQTIHTQNLGVKKLNAQDFI